MLEEKNTIERAYYDNGDGTTTDVTASFISAGTDATLFENDNSIIYLANETEEFNFIAFALATEGNKNIEAEYSYCTGDNTWVTLPGVVDTTAGFTTSGSITFNNPGDRGLCDEEIDSTAFADTTDRAYIAIKRTRNSFPGAKPVEDLVTIGGGGDYLYMDMYGYKPVPSSGAPYGCASGTAGMQYYDSSDSHFYGCNGTDWKQLDN